MRLWVCHGDVPVASKGRSGTRAALPPTDDGGGRVGRRARGRERGGSPAGRQGWWLPWRCFTHGSLAHRPPMRWVRAWCDVSLVLPLLALARACQAGVAGARHHNTSSHLRAAWAAGGSVRGPALAGRSPTLPGGNFGPTHVKQRGQAQPHPPCHPPTRTGRASTQAARPGQTKGKRLATALSLPQRSCEATACPRPPGAPGGPARRSPSWRARVAPAPARQGRRPAPLSAAPRPGTASAAAPRWAAGAGPS